MRELVGKAFMTKDGGASIIKIKNGNVIFELTSNRFRKPVMLSIQELVTNYMTKDSVLYGKIKIEYPEYFI